MKPEFSYTQLHQDFSNTSWGATLSRSTRFDPFRQQASLSPDEWWTLLGADVNTLRHIKLTYGMTRWFCGQDASYTPDEKYQLMLSAMIHDWAESVVGDIPAPLKTGSHDEIEQKELHTIIDAFCEKYPKYTHCQNDMHTVTDTVIFTKNTKLGNAFHAIELLGYCRTMIRAWQGISEAQEPTTTALRGLVSSVMIHDYGKLEVLALKYPAIQAFVNNPVHQQIITEIRVYHESKIRS